MSGCSLGKKAARTKRKIYGVDGLSEIAKRAYLTRNERRGQILSALDLHLARVAGGAVTRARRQGWPYEPDLAGWALATMEAQKHRCALSGVEFSLECHGHGAAPRPFAPSIDRIDASRGYTAENIRIVCWAVNLLLGTWGDKPALKVAQGISRKSRRLRVI